MSSTLNSLSTRLPTDEEANNAAALASALARAQKLNDGTIYIRDGKHDGLAISPAVVDLLLNLLGLISANQMITLVPTGSLLTTQKAADLLNISRPHLVKLLKENEISYVNVGTHRKIKFEDLMAYKDRRDKDQLKALDDIIEIGQEIEEG